MRIYGGEGGIRTPGSLSTTPDFESGAFNRALPPLRFVYIVLRDIRADLIWPEAVLTQHSAQESPAMQINRGHP